MKAYLRLFKHLITCLFLFFAVKAFLYILQPHAFQRKLLVYRSKVRSAVAVITLDKEHLKDFYWKENITRVIEQYQAEGFSPYLNQDGDSNNNIRHVYETLKNNKDYSRYSVTDGSERVHRHIALSQIPSVHSGLIMDWWYDTCFQRTTWERTWYPLFPELPQNRTIAKIAGDTNIITGNYMRRIFGFLYTNESGFYHIQLLSRDGAELMIADTNTRLDGETFQVNNGGNSNNLKKIIESAESVLYSKLTKTDMEDQEIYLQMEDMYATKPQKIWLTAGIVYSIEVIQGGDLYTRFQVRWKKSDGKHRLKVIGENNLFFTNSMLREQTPSKIFEKSKLREIFPTSNEERRRNSFFKIPTLKGAQEKVRRSSFNCKATRLRHRKTFKLYDGFLKNVENTISYPREFFLFKYHSKLKDMLMDENEAVKMAKKVFDKLNTLYNG